jgi:hypothetical protein
MKLIGDASVIEDDEERTVQFLVNNSSVPRYASKLPQVVWVRFPPVKRRDFPCSVDHEAVYRVVPVSAERFLNSFGLAAQGAHFVCPCMGEVIE